MPRDARIALLVLVAVLGSGCLVAVREPAPLELPGTPNEDRELDAEDLWVRDGFHVEEVVDGLTFPSAITWDEDGRAYLALAGPAFGSEDPHPAAVLRVQDDGSVTVVADGFVPPVTDITWHDGKLYVSERGRVVALDPTRGWAVEPVVTGLPSFGDYTNNEVLFGPDGRLVVLQGTATNSGVVGLDNPQPWVVNITEGHDVPCEDVVLAGVNYRTPNPFVGRVIRGTSETVVYDSPGAIPPGAAGVSGDEVVTGAFVPFGTPTFEGQVIEGNVPCNGAVLVADPDGTDLEVLAWGFRNPFGGKFDADGNLWVTETGYDYRGSRPVSAGADHFWRVHEGRWHGWPDWEAGESLAEPQYAIVGAVPNPVPVLAEPPGARAPPAPPVNLTIHSTATKFAFSPGGEWGPGSTVYLAEWGDLTPGRGHRGENGGFAVVTFDVAGDVAEPRVDDLVRGAGRFDPRFRPIEAAFGPDGLLYVVNFGKVGLVDEIEGPEAAPVAGTGTLFVVMPDGVTQVPEAGPEEGVRDEPPSTRTPAPAAPAAVAVAVAVACLVRGRARP